MSEAKNVKAIRQWLTAHRPDTLQQFEQIVAGEARGDDRYRALFWLLAVGFDAGREYQRANPNDVGP